MHKRCTHNGHATAIATCCFCKSIHINNTCDDDMHPGVGHIYGPQNQSEASSPGITSSASQRSGTFKDHQVRPLLEAYQVNPLREDEEAALESRQSPSSTTVILGKDQEATLESFSNADEIIPLPSNVNLYNGVLSKPV